jgi:hypothetical protein
VIPEVAAAPRRAAVAVKDLLAALGPPPPQSIGVFVLGMHRSGTSLLTRIVHLLGVPVGREEDLMKPDEANINGYWESDMLTAFQERLLRRLGGGWGAPPPLSQGWERSPRLLLDVGRARRIFRRVYGTMPVWAWKDPRTSLTLPLWLRALRLRPLLIVVHRHPLEVARSLAVRDGFEKTRALALWEEYNRTLLANAEGLPALVVSYEDLVRDPVAVAKRASEFLAQLGVRTDFDEQTVVSCVDQRLRHSTYGDSDLKADPDVTDEQRSLVRLLRSLEGAHGSLDALGAEARTG